MELRVDTGDLKRLERDLGRVPAEVVPKVVAIVKRGAQNIKTDWQKAWSGHPHIKHLPRAVTYDMKITPRGVSAEIGPELGKRQGPLGGIIEHGSPTSAPIPGGLPAADREEPRFFAQLELLAGRVLDA